LSNNNLARERYERNLIGDMLFDQMYRIGRTRDRAAKRDWITKAIDSSPHSRAINAGKLSVRRNRERERERERESHAG